MLRKQKVSFAEADLSRCEKVTFAPGTLIFADGDSADRAFIIESGAVEIFKINRQGQGVTLNLLRPGAMFGELALISQNNRSASARAAVETCCYVITATQFAGLFDDLPPLQRNIVAQLINTLYRATHSVVASTETAE